MLDGISWVWWLIGTFGVVGTIALAVLAPEALLIVWKIINTILSWMISTRIGCAILAFIIAFIIADIHRSRLDRADWNRQIAEYQIEQEARDARINEEISKRVMEKLQAEPAIVKQEDVVAQEIKNDIPKDPTACRRVGAAAPRLRALGAGKSGKSNQRQVLKAAWARATPLRHRGQ